MACRLSSRTGGVRPCLGFGAADENSGLVSCLKFFMTKEKRGSRPWGAILSFWTPFDQYGVRIIVMVESLVGSFV